ncbi:unnamed protein product [Closterium sp. NIES-65]|nr:unnamed protein product [Closterium sp. NIES-65]
MAVRMAWHGCPYGLAWLSVWLGMAVRMAWHGCPYGLAWLSVWLGMAVRMAWHGCPYGLAWLSVWLGMAVRMAWHGCPYGLAWLSVWLGMAVRMAWHGCPYGLAWLSVWLGMAVRMAWHGCPSHLPVQMAVRMAWHGCPSHLPPSPSFPIFILCGLVLGKLACTIAYRRPSSLPSPPSARHIAFSVAQSIGLSPSAAALLSGLPFPQRDGGEEGAAGGEKVVPGRGVLSAPGMVGAAERAAGRKESVVMAACAFGNSLTLPLVFLATLLTRADADRAAGYLALFMVGGSTAFWTLGYSMFRGGSNAQEEGDEEGVEGSAAAKMEATAAAAAAMGMTGFERAASRVMEMAKKVLNPPIYGVLAGLLIGATPLGHFFLPASSSSSAAAASSLPASSWLFSPATAGILHGLMEAAAILGIASEAAATTLSSSALSSASSASSPSSSAAALPSLQDDRALWVVCAVRLLLLPMLGTVAVTALYNAKLIPQDPICALTLMIQTAMPSAQNLVLMAQLSPATKPLAGMLASLMLRQCGSQSPPPNFHLSPSLASLPFFPCSMPLPFPL